MPAPHLPPQTSSIAWRARLVFARTLLVVLLVALAAGATAALVVLAWYPEIIGTGREPFIPLSSEGAARTSSFDPTALTQTIERATVGIYRAGDSVRRLNVTFYPREAAVGWGVFLTDDGWLLTTKEVARAASDLRVIDARGTAYPVERTAHDSMTGLSFLKVAGDGFAEVPIVERDPGATGTTVYSIDSSSSLTKISIGSPEYNRSEPLVSGELTRLMRLEDARITEGAPLFTAQGFLIGMAHHRDVPVIIPVMAARSIFDRIFSQSTISSAAVRITYLMMPDVIPNDIGADREAPRLGAYVLRVQRGSTYRGPLPTLEQRDIITAVDDEPVTTRETLALLLARIRPAKDALFTVYRAGEYLRIPVVLNE